MTRLVRYGRRLAGVGLLMPLLAGICLAEDEAAPSEPDLQTETIRERYPNRRVKVERQVTQDASGNYVNHGPWTMWDENGTMVAKGQYRLGQREGTWTRWHTAADSKLFGQSPYSLFLSPYISVATFKDGNLDGKWTIYDAKQRKISEVEYANGERDGLAVWYYPNGKKMRENTYKGDAIDGELLQWNGEGQPVTRDTFQEGRKLAAKVTYFNGGRKKTEGMYLFAKIVVKTPDDWWNAAMATYTTQGKDERHGVWRTFFENGQTQQEGEYRNDLQVGKSVWWYSNGQKASEGGFVDGKQDGAWVWWHPNGQKKTEGEYNHGAPSSRWTWWADTGKVSQAADFSHGEGEVVRKPSISQPEGVSNRRQALLPEPSLAKPLKPIKK